MQVEKTGRIRKQALFASIGYRPHAGQVLVHKSRAPRRVLACGVRWGKSLCGAMEAVAALLEPREQSIGWVVGPTYLLSERIFELAATTVERHFRHRIRLLDRRDHRLVVSNLGGGVSEMRGMSADNPASLLGEGLDWIVVDECARLKREVWYGHLSQRLIDRQGWALLLSTPRGPGWFRQVYLLGQGRDAAYESWSSPSWTNPILSRELIEEERRRLPAGSFAQEYEAQFQGVENEACETCGWPNVMACSVLVLERDEPEPGKCRDCGRFVDAEGRTSMGRDRNGEPYITFIRLYGRGEPVEVPGAT